jgi:hypothetical protein
MAELDVLARWPNAPKRWTGARRTHRRARHRIERGRHPVVEKVRDEPFEPNDLRSTTRTPHAGDHRPEHGRQIHVHAAERADRAARAYRQLRAGERAP